MKRIITLIVLLAATNAQAFGLWDSGGLGTASSHGNIYNWYVDSVNGNDANSGKTQSQAFATIGALTGKVSTYQRIGLARGSYWREQLRITPNNVTVAAYGTGKMPTLNAADVAVNASFTKSGGYTNLYQRTWTNQFGENGKMFYSVWEDGRRLIRATSIANADATPGSFFAATPTVGSTDTIYVNAVGSTDVTANGKIYEISKRDYGLKLADNATARNIHTMYNGHNNGSLEVGLNAYVSGCLFEDGTIHNVLIGSGVMEDCIAWKQEVYATFGGATMYVAFTGTPSLNVIFRRCRAIGGSIHDPNNVGGNVGFLSHGPTPRYNSITYEDCLTVNLGSGFSPEVDNLYIIGGKGTRTILHITPTATTQTTITDYWYNGDDADVVLQRVISPTGTTPVTIKRMKGTSRTPNAALFYRTGDLSIENSTFAFFDTAVTRRGFDLATGNITAFNNNILYDMTAGYYLGAGVSVLAATNNVVYPATTDMQVNNVLYNDMAAYKAAYPLLDVNTSTSDPLFAGNPRTGDFSLQAGSPAIALQSGVTMATIQRPVATEVYQFDTDRAALDAYISGL